MTIESHGRLPAAVLLLLLGTFCRASDTVKATDLPDGATLVVRLEQDVRADRLKPGAEVHAKVIAPAMIDGAVAIPVGATITAVVVHAEPLTTEHPSRLVLLFHHANWPNAVRALNAYVVRQLVLKRTYSLDSRAFCAPGERYERPQRQNIGETAEPLSMPSDANDCRAPVGTQRDTSHPLTFTSPSFVGIVLRKLSVPQHAIALEAAKAHVVLRKGMMLEIRHSAE